MEITDLCSPFIIIKDYKDDTIKGHVVIPPCSGSELTWPLKPCPSSDCRKLWYTWLARAITVATVSW